MKNETIIFWKECPPKIVKGMMDSRDCQCSGFCPATNRSVLYSAAIYHCSGHHQVITCFPSPTRQTTNICWPQPSPTARTEMLVDWPVTASHLHLTSSASYLAKYEALLAALSQRYPLKSVRVSSILPRYGDGWGSLGRKLSILTSSPPYYLLSSSSNVTSSNRYWLREYWRSTINCTSRNPTMVIQSHPVSPIKCMYCQFIHINQLFHHIKPILPQR